MNTYRNRWASPQCVPRQERRLWAQKGRVHWRLQRQARMFRELIERYVGGQRVVTKAMLYDLCQEAYARGLNARRQMISREARRAA